MPDVLILASCPVPPVEPRADADPDLALSRTLLAALRAAKLQPGDLVLFTRPVPAGGDLRLFGGSCEDVEEDP